MEVMILPPAINLNFSGGKYNQFVGHKSSSFWFRNQETTTAVTAGENGTHVTAGEESCNCNGYRPEGPGCLQPSHPGGGRQDLVCVWPAWPAGDKLTLGKMLMVLLMQANGELVAGVEEQTRQALVNMGHLLQVSMVNICSQHGIPSLGCGLRPQARGEDHRAAQGHEGLPRGQCCLRRVLQGGPSSKGDLPGDLPASLSNHPQPFSPKYHFLL